VTCASKDNPRNFSKIATPASRNEDRMQESDAGQIAKGFQGEKQNVRHAFAWQEGVREDGGWLQGPTYTFQEIGQPVLVQ
jgi:hypothetical protein